MAQLLKIKPKSKTNTKSIKFTKGLSTLVMRFELAVIHVQMHVHVLWVIPYYKPQHSSV